MGIAQNLSNIGRPVAFHPGIKKVAKTTNATLLLCQLLYWSDKTNGWIIKDSNEIRNETGLSYQEQRTARKVLLENGLIEENRMRLEHSVGFKVCMDTLNAKWEEVEGLSLDEALKNFSEEEQEKQEKQDIKSRKNQEVVNEKEVANDTSTIQNFSTLPAGEKQVEEQAKQMAEPSIKKQAKQASEQTVEKENANVKADLKLVVSEKKKIKEAIIKKLGINPIGSKWEEFVNFAYDRQVNHGEPASKFLYWAKNNGFNPVYWTPQKMMILYPQAFVTKKQEQEPEFDETFAPLEEPIVEEEYIPMPDYFKPKYKLD